MAIAIFFVAHWQISVFFQTFYLHRYGAHRQFTLTPFWDRFFYVCTFVTQGSSFLSPRGYGILHRMHHAFSDTPKDPHTPTEYTNVFSMMLATKKMYDDFAYRRVEPEARFDGGLPSWPLPREGELQSVVRPHRVHVALRTLLLPVRDAPVDVGALAGALHHGADPRSHRQLVRPQVRLPQLRQRRRVAQHLAVRLSSRRGSSSRTTTTNTWMELKLSRCVGSRSIRRIVVMRVLAALRIIDMSGAQVPVYPERRAAKSVTPATETDATLEMT